MYIGKIRLYAEKENVDWLGHKLAIVFYDDDDKFVETKIFYSKDDKCFPVIMKICDIVIARGNMVITDAKCFDESEYMARHYSSKLVFKDKRIIA